MTKTGWIILSVSLVLNVVLGWLLFTRNKDPIKVPTTVVKYVERIDSLNSELDTIKEHRDQVKKSIDTVYIELENTKVTYEKACSTIVNNTTSDDLLFFREYLRRNAARRDSINYIQ